MMNQYMKSEHANWKVSKYFRNLSSKPKICPVKSKTKAIPKHSSIKHKAASKYFWLEEKFTRLTLNNNDRAIMSIIIISRLKTNETSNQISIILLSFIYIREVSVTKF